MDFALDQLRALLAVVDNGTFEAAAVTLNVTPSAISQRIKALEIGIGRVLIQRQRPLRVTESGAAVLRLARQMALLEHDTIGELDPDGQTQRTTIPIVINADSLAVWVMPALAEANASAGIQFDIYREDQDHSTALLRNGTVMAAITSVADPVQGCIVNPLGKMRYRPMATPEFARRWFADGVSAESLAVAPVVVFDRKDELQDRYLRSHKAPPTGPPRHHIPASSEFATAVKLGLGWGMLPEAQSTEQEAAGTLVAFDPKGFSDVPLYWQQWKLSSGLLTTVADAISAAARRELHQEAVRPKTGVKV